MSTIKTNNVQLGQSATATQNFTLTTGSDGTAKLARGNVGATTSDIITINSLDQLTISGLTVGAGPGNISSNTVFGKTALSTNTSGGNNVAVGWVALGNNTTGQANIAVGSFASSNNTTGSSNTSVGNGANASAFTASYNTAIGNQAGGGLAYTGDNNTFIGHNASGSSTGVTNSVTLGNTAITVLRCQVTSITAISDARDKTDVKPLSAGLDFLMMLNPVTFTWNSRDGEKVGIKASGFIAQELLAAETSYGCREYTDLVSQDNPDRLEARYSHLIPVLVKALQDLKNEFDAYKLAHP